MLIQKQNVNPHDHLPKGPSQEEIMQLITQQFALAEQMISKHMYQEALKKIAENVQDQSGESLCESLFGPY